MPDVVAAPLLSPGARHLVGECGAGWLDETGAAEISDGLLLISRSGTVPPRRTGDPQWRPATLAVCEALLTGCPATATAVTGRTGLAASTVVGALKFLDRSGFLSASAARGRLSGRYVSDAEGLLDAYASAAGQLRSAIALRVGAIWRDPLSGAVSAGERWGDSGISWAVTSALAADVLAPMLAEPAPLEVYVGGRTLGDLRKSAEIAGLREMEGGRILLRPFPTLAGQMLREEIKPGLISALWPRVYADLRIVGVRGEDAAEHLREEMSRARDRATAITSGAEGR